MSFNLFISAGEASGEHYGALLISAIQKKLKAQNREAAYFGMGGERMAAAGLERIVRSEDVAVMGITEVVRHLPRIYAEFRKLKQAIRTRRPSAAILIDFPDIHFKLAKELHELGIPVIFFVSPQLWAWKKHRIGLVQKYVDRMLVIFPFEEQFYRERGVQAEFVGHPLADLPLPTISREEFAGQNCLDAGRTWVALLPGSRPREIRANLPEMLQAARLLLAKYRDLQFIIPLAPTLTPEQRNEVFKMEESPEQSDLGHVSPRFTDDARAALHHARASIVASGTATVEAALIGNPFVVVYRVSPLTYAIAKRVVTVPHVAMANLIAGKRVVPELIQDEFTASKIVQHIEPLLPDGLPRESMKKELTSVGDSLRARQAARPGQITGAIERVAAITLELIQAASPASEPTVVQSEVQS
jgi:lipid-A-disaccharide synthase